MAVVYRAYDRHLDRFVAIKIMSPDCSTAIGTERFQREIGLTAKLVHPGIVALFDSGATSGQLYYVMPLMAGETLRARLVRERRMSVGEALAIGADVAEALAYAHGCGVVHRDVKPENIFAVGGRALLADFGIARIVGLQTSAHETLTSAGMVLGTAAYMSPEQVAGEAAIDGRADLYSLGCVIYELLTGAPPFTGGTAMGVMARHITEAPRPARTHNADLAEEVDALLMKLLAKDPDMRPATAAEAARALRAVPQVGAAPVQVASAHSEADRLVAQGSESYHFGTTGGTSARSSFDQAGVYFRRALTIDPQHGRGLCGLGNWYYMMGTAGFIPKEEAFSKGRELLLAALAADDMCADVHCSLGKLALYHDDDCHAALRHVRRAVMLEPENPEVLRFYSITLKLLGRTEESVQAARAATACDTTRPSLWNALGDALLAAGRNAEAVDALKMAITLQPGFGPALARLERAHARLGELALAIEVRSVRIRLTGDGARAQLLLDEADIHGADEALRRDLRRELEGLLMQAGTIDPFADSFATHTLADRIVLGYVDLGGWQDAMDWVERAYDRRPGRLRRMLKDQLFDHHRLAMDPRFTRLLRVSGMEDLL